MKKWLLIVITIIFLGATVIGMNWAERTAFVPAVEQTTAILTAEAVQHYPAVDAETIGTEFLDAVSRYEPGTAGSSLKRAVAAMRVLEFCNAHHLAETDREKFTENLLAAWKEYPETKKELFPELFASVADQVDEDLQKGTALSGLFDDAGILEEMQQLLAQDGLQASWETLKACAEALN